jgi:hypothetical protein
VHWPLVRVAVVTSDEPRAGWNVAKVKAVLVDREFVEQLPPRGCYVRILGREPVRAVIRRCRVIQVTGGGELFGRVDQILWVLT